MRKVAYFISLILLCFIVFSCSNKSRQNNPTNEDIPSNATSLFNGKSLDGWEITKFGTEGPVMVSDGKIVINYGDGCSGITYQYDFPKKNYEVQLEARKTVGNDFFCGMTFPVDDDFCSLIVGGWGGPVIGLSCIDGLDAGDNETQVLKRFEKDVWYTIRLKVGPSKIKVWIDEEQLVDFSYLDRKLSIRPEVELSKPFGICTWMTTAELRNVWVREVL